MFSKIRAPRMLRALGQRLRGIDRIGLAVLRQKDARRPDRRSFSSGQQLLGLLRRSARRPRGRSIAPWRRRASVPRSAPRWSASAMRADLLEARRLAGLLLQRGVESAVYCASRVRLCVARSCPTSPAACQVVPQVSCLRSSSTHVGDAALGQVIGDAAPDDAAADDDDLGLSGKFGHDAPLVMDQDCPRSARVRRGRASTVS